ncbi:helix-turn-helix domain-containing protein [Mesorhizobium sp. NBSH29]|uniref:IclR family transcriptional regulator n=1 Tax=Mesorhizobium sp. NBSH29 TaxID=2654249 RepID=UPI0018969CC2|nr:IclR family transcriptional regulator [Mesorhizobium sp. NBSH29]QPC85808.1 helix-turn-helix domain-containing protein [Mesorhizobium sp. NBSH29]
MLTKNTEKGSRARGLDRAVDILEFLRLSLRPANPNEIAVAIGAPRSTVYELVSILLENGLLERATAGEVYLGRRLYFLGNAYAEHFDIGSEAKKLLNALATETRETAQLCMLDGNKYTVAQMVEGARPFRISSNIRERLPIPWTASGRLLVEHMSNDEIIDFIPADDFIMPDGTLLDTTTFLNQVHASAKSGYFSQPSVTDTFTHCFAAPVRRPDGRCFATLCLVAPEGDGVKNHAAYVSALVSAAATLSRHADIL